MANLKNQVAEMPGLYGPFTITERVVQKIWLRGDFNSVGMMTSDGRSLDILSPGKWNLLGGPDFKRARLRIAGREVVGDVEVHFHARDWRAHGHQTDPAYAEVCLHVVLFPPAEGERAVHRFDGTEIPTAVLLPYLHRGLEEYGSDDALESLTERDEWQHYAELADQSPDELRMRFQGLAEARWRQKVYFANQRLARLGWESALHHGALEVLGYRQNRATMLAVAGRYPLAAWRDGIDLEAVWNDSGLRWQTQGVRPANHPRKRLQQYLQWVSACPDWPIQLKSLATEWVGEEIQMGEATKLARRELHLAGCRDRLIKTLIGDAIGGSRLDNLVCDGFLPLLAAHQPDAGFGAFWFHWPLGDIPVEVRRVLTKLEVVDRRRYLHCHGWGQGMLSWFLARAAVASA